MSIMGKLDMAILAWAFSNARVRLFKNGDFHNGHHSKRRDYHRVKLCCEAGLRLETWDLGGGVPIEFVYISLDIPTQMG